MSKDNKNIFELHQLLAAIPGRESQANKLIKEAAVTFQNKDSHFNGRTKQYYPDNEVEGSHIQDEFEKVEMVYTVKEKVDFIKKSFANAVDSVLSKEETNSSGNANAMLQIGPRSVKLSATSLLALEKKVVTLRSLILTIPTLDPSKQWHFDQNEGFYKTNPTKRNRIIKKNESVVVVQATDKFPAQVKEVTVESKVGHYEETHFSSKFPVRVKSEMVAKCDELLNNIAIARAEANKCQVREVKVMESVFDFILGSK